MKKYEAETMFAAAIYGTLYPIVLANHAEKEETSERDLSKDLRAMLQTALNEAGVICRSHRAMHTKFGWHRK